jgi:bifunctional DNA-binding transcriptional regulator/antitoxin component of YhaV-PrlF toxin-antitoxin module
MKAILRNTDIHAVQNGKITGVINIPSEIWKDAGWEIGDDVHLIVCENMNSKGEEWLSITIERTKDLERYDEDYPYKEEDE